MDVILRDLGRVATVGSLSVNRLWQDVPRPVSDFYWLRDDPCDILMDPFGIGYGYQDSQGTREIQERARLALLCMWLESGLRVVLGVLASTFAEGTGRRAELSCGAPGPTTDPISTLPALSSSSP